MGAIFCSPPPEGLGVGRFALSNPLLNHFQNRFLVMFNLIVPESKKMNAKPLKSLLSLCIFIGLKIMTLTIYFNRQLQVLAVEVYNVLVDGVLPIEIVATHPFPSQILPQKDFR